MSISLNQSDKIRLIEYPKGMAEELQRVITDAWGHLQHSQEMQDGIWEYKLKVGAFERTKSRFLLKITQGNPWMPHGVDEAVRARQLVMSIVNWLQREGWVSSSSLCER